MEISSAKEKQKVFWGHFLDVSFREGNSSYLKIDGTGR